MQSMPKDKGNVVHNSCGPPSIIEACTLAAVSVLITVLTWIRFLHFTSIDNDVQMTGLNN